MTELTPNGPDIRVSMSGSLLVPASWLEHDQMVKRELDKLQDDCSDLADEAQDWLRRLAGLGDVIGLVLRQHEDGDLTAKALERMLQRFTEDYDDIREDIDGWKRAD